MAPRGILAVSTCMFLAVAAVILSVSVLVDASRISSISITKNSSSEVEDPILGICSTGCTLANVNAKIATTTKLGTATKLLIVWRTHYRCSFALLCKYGDANLNKQISNAAYIVPTTMTICYPGINDKTKTSCPANPEEFENKDVV